MPFLPLEQSNYSGEPVLLYEFRRGAQRLLYASADRDIQAGDDTYQATAMSNEGNKQTGEAAQDVFKITAPFDIELAGWYRYTPPSDLVYLIVRRFHFGDTQAVVAWIGTVVSVAMEDLGQVTINCQAISVSLKRTGLRLAWQRGCPHALYDQNCRANRDDFKVTRTIIGIGDSFISIGAISSTAAWAGGYIEFLVAPGTYERRLIESVIPSISGTPPYAQISPFGQMDGYTMGMSINLYPGCLHTSAWCANFFNNFANYGGFQYMPNRTPYDGDPIF